MVFNQSRVIQMKTIQRTFNGKGEMDFVVVMVVTTIMFVSGFIFH